MRLLKHTVTDGFANAWGQLDPHDSLFERQEGLLRGLERVMSWFQCTNSSDRDEEEGPKAIWRWYSRTPSPAIEEVGWCFDAKDVLMMMGECERTSRMRIALENYRARLRMSFHQLAALHAGLIHVANIQGEGANDRNIRCASDNGYVSSNISRSLLEQDIWILAAMWTGSQDTLDLTQDQDQQLQQLTALGGLWVRQWRTGALTAWVRMMALRLFPPRRNFKLPSIRSQQYVLNNSMRAVANAWGWEEHLSYSEVSCSKPWLS